MVPGGRGCSTDMLDCPLPPENTGSAPGTCELPQNVKLKIILNATCPRYNIDYFSFFHFFQKPYCLDLIGSISSLARPPYQHFCEVPPSPIRRWIQVLSVGNMTGLSISRINAVKISHHSTEQGKQAQGADDMWR